MKPVPLPKFKKFLKKIGLVHKRTEGGHEMWDYPDDSLERPVTLQTHEKEVPRLHIKTNLKTIGMDIKEFEKIIKAL